MSNLYEMKLHETIVAECDDLFTVVLSGWMYRSYDKNHGILTSVFVPFDNEFQEKK
jgi:hypothetical protein